jgi:putative ABC transport system permease protein
MARLKPHVTLEQAQTEMNTIAHRLALEYPKTNKEENATNIIPLRQMISGDIRSALLVLLCAVGFVLLIACANLANLLLARAADRQKEVAVRTALGANRFRLLRQFLTESVLLGLAGGVLGSLLAFWCARGLVLMFPSTIFNRSIPALDKIPVDGWVLGFALVVSLLTGVIFGLVPAFQACRLKTEESLKESGRSVSASAQGRRLRSNLVVTEVAVSLILLVGAGLTIKSFARLLEGNLGFNPEHVLTLRVLLPDYKYHTEGQQIAFSDQALEGIKSLPGVATAGTVSFLPLSGWWGERTVTLEGRATPENQRPMAVWSSVTPDYFRAMGIPLLEGRFFAGQDKRGAAAVAILSKSLARQLVPNEDAVGKRINVDGLEGVIEIVGVVGEVRQLGMTSEMTREIYFPYPQVPAPIICFAIRTAGEPAGLAKAAQRAIWAVDKDQAVGFVMTMSQLASESLAPQRVMTILLGTFAGLAVLMAAVGLYGVTSYSVSQLTHEIGIRVALGAHGGDVLRLVVGEGIALVSAGVAIGLVGTLSLMRFVSSLLYGVHPSDPLILTIVPVVLTGVGLLATYIPARRAMKVDPMVALRYE